MNRDERQKYDNWRDRGSDQRRCYFFERTIDCLKSSLPEVSMQDDVLDDNDCIVDNQSDGSCQSTKRHQIETLADGLQYDESNHDGDRNHHPSDGRAAPIAQEHDDDNRGQHQPNQDRISHATDGVPHQS